MHTPVALFNRARVLHELVFRPPRPPFKYQEWMDSLADHVIYRRTGKYVDFNALKEAYEAGLSGDMDKVDLYLGMHQLAKEED